MSGKLKSKYIELLWVLVPLVVVAEVFVQWRIPAQEPSEEEWRAAVSYVRQQKQDDYLVVFTPTWAAQARMYLKDLISLRDFGRFETTRYTGIIELSVGDRKAPEVEGLKRVSVRTFGEITVSLYDNPQTVTVLYDFLEHYPNMEVGGGAHHSPKIFIDHWFRPRNILFLDLKSRVVSATFKNVPLDGVIHGYGIIAYREARFNRGTPVELSIFVNDKKIGEHKINNFDLVEPFNFATNSKGRGTVRFDVKTRTPVKRRFGFVADVRRKMEGGR